MKSFLDSTSDCPPAVVEPSPPRLSATVDDLDRILSVNLKGTFLCYKYAGKHMIAQGRGGRIIGALNFRQTHHSFILNPSS
jgi:NAD(P)-dependent dehydrogenase (short-subunit alcohol dehydrogenase family)